VAAAKVGSESVFPVSCVCVTVFVCVCDSFYVWEESFAVVSLWCGAAQLLYRVSLLAVCLPYY
jgi:hypothetical protein